jgi:uncharacterized protein (TIGR01777 family)
MRVFVTGGTGLVGTRLVGKLLDRGDQPVVLTRRFAAARQGLGPQVELVEGDPMKVGPWTEKLDDCDGVIHLAGENIFGKRWSEKFKQLLVDSRVQSTQNIVAALARKPRRADGSPRVLVNASAIGYYGPRGDEEITEDSPPGTDFLAQLCVRWEQAARAVESAGLRCAIVRVGVVLDTRGGALVMMRLPAKLFVGGPVGSGRQYVSWIHHDDIVGLFLFALDNPHCSGPLNGTAPNPLTHHDFMRVLGKALGRPSFVWTPAFALRVMLGEVAGLVTTGQRVQPGKALALGYTFQYPALDVALADLFRAPTP